LKTLHSRNGSINILLILLYVTAFIIVNIRVDGAQTNSGDAYFTHILVTNGKDAIDLISGGIAKVYSLQAPVWVNLTVYNENCTTQGLNYANFVVDVTEDSDTNSWTLERVFKGGSKDLPLAYPYGITGPKTVNLKAELFLNRSGTYYLEDVRQFSIKVVLLSIEENSINLSLVEICQTDSFDLTLNVQNMGNDVAYATNIIIGSSGELSVIGGASCYLGDLGANEIGTASFSFSVPLQASIGVHTITFTCTYNDFSQRTRNNSITTEIVVKDASIKQRAQNSMDQAESKIKGMQVFGCWSKDAQTKLDEAIVEYEKAVMTYEMGNYTYAAYYANKAIELLNEANQIETIYRIPMYAILALACTMAAIIIYAIIKRKRHNSFQ